MEAKFFNFFIFYRLNLNDKFSFNSILYLIALNSIQIFTYIPSHLFILSFCLFIIHLKTKNELTIIKEYIGLKNLFFIILPILILFILFETNKDYFSTNIEKIKSNLISSKNLEDKKIFISSDGYKKKYTIFSGYDEEKGIVNQYLKFEKQNQTINKGEIINNLFLNEKDLLSTKSTIYENNDFRYENNVKIIFENFIIYWTTNTGVIIKNKVKGLSSNFNKTQSIIFYILFYFCITMIFFSKRLVNRGSNNIKIFFLILSIFLYYLLIPKIMLNNFQYSFQIISIVIFLLTFLKLKQYE